MRELVIPGGNHAQFGLYGPQDGDGEAGLSPGEQRALVADEIAGVFLRGLEGLPGREPGRRDALVILKS